MNLISDINLFADDTALLQLYDVQSEAEIILNHDLKLIASWGKQWLVEFNPNKTVFMNISLKKHKSNLEIMFNGINIKQISEQKHLGIILFEDKKWSKHIGYICSRVCKKIGLLYRSSMYLNTQEMANLLQKCNTSSD